MTTPTELESIAVPIAKRRGLWDKPPHPPRVTQPAIRVMDALRLMGDGEVMIGEHRFTAISGVPFEMPHGVIVRDMTDGAPTKTWPFDAHVSLSGELLEGYEEVSR